MTPERWDHIADLLNSALERTPDERSAYLERVCADDPEMRTLLDDLIEADDVLGDELEAGLGAPNTHLHAALMGVFATSEVPATLPDLIGQKVGPYEVQGRIGQGGMGVVYRAWDARLERFAALKCLPAHLQSDDRARERFMREARAVSAVDHPNVCTIYEVTAIDAVDGPPLTYIAMAYYEGETLDERIATGPLSVAESITIAEQVLCGLVQAHARGIIHRDVKPSNVMLPEDRPVKLLDFGIAKRATGSALTRTAATPGTLAYMAPEQVRGEAIGPYTDLWALGAMWYEMLTGQRPFTGDTTAAVIYGILEDDPPRLQQIRPGMPGTLAAIVERLLHKSPEHRYTSATDVLDDLRAFDAPPTASDEPPASASSQGSAKRPVIGRIAARARAQPARWVAALIVAAVLGVWVWAQGGAPSAPSESPARPSRSIAVLPFSVHGGDDLAYLREGLVVLLSTKLDGTASLRSIDPNAIVGIGAGRSVSVFDPEKGQRLAERFGAEQYVLGSVLRVGDGLQISASLYGARGVEQARAEAFVASEASLLAGVDQLAQQLVASQLDDPDEQLSSLAALTTDSFAALKAYLQGERALREGRFEEAIQTLQAAVAQDSTFALAWYRLARAAGWVGGPDGSRINFIATEQAQAHSDVLPARTQRLIQAYHAFRMGDPREAEQRYRSILATHPDDVETWLLLGETLFHNNPFYGRSTIEAREPFERALAIEPDSRELLVHLIDIAAKTRDHDRLESLTARYLGHSKGPTLAYLDHAYRALQTLALEPDADSQRVYNGLKEAGHMAVMAGLMRVYPQLSDAEVGQRMSALAVATAPTPAERTQGQLYKAYLSAARGQWSKADQIFAALDSSAHGWALIYRTLIATVPHADVDLAALRADIDRWNPSTHPPTGGAHDDDLEALKPFLRGLVSVRMGDERAARRAIQQLMRTDLPDAPKAATSYAHTVEAYLIWQRGEAAETLDLLVAAERPLPFAVRNRSPLHEQVLNRFLCAEAFRAQGQPRDALAWYTALNDGYYLWGSPYMAVASLRRASIHAQQGDAGQAADAYHHFINTWRTADPAVQPLVQQARKDMERFGKDLSASP